MLTLTDEYARECLAIRVARRFGSYEVIEALADMVGRDSCYWDNPALCLPFSRLS